LEYLGILTDSISLGVLCSMDKAVLGCPRSSGIMILLGNDELLCRVLPMLAPNFPWDGSLLTCETFLRTRSPMSNLLTFTLYFGHCSLVLCHSLHSFVSHLVDQIQIVVKFLLVPLLFISFDPDACQPTSTGTTTSVPNVSLNGVSLVGTLVVVLYAHKTLGSSSGHAPFPLQAEF